jgi:hypothetical protein
MAARAAAAKDSAQENSAMRRELARDAKNIWNYAWLIYKPEDTSQQIGGKAC